MRKAKLYLRLFWLPLLLVILATISWFLLDSFNDYRSNLIATSLGVGISIALANSYQQLAKYTRLKRCLLIFKITAIPFLENQSQNIEGNLERYDDIASVEHATAALDFFSGLNEISGTYGGSWQAILFSSDFIESIKTDEQYNVIYRAAYEQALFTRTITWHALSARSLLNRPALNPKPIEDQITIDNAKRIRNDIRRENASFNKAIEKFDEEVIKLIKDTGVGYESIDRK